MMQPFAEGTPGPLRASIIIPAYNAERTIAECLRACLSQDYPDVELIVVDDGSTDRTPRVAAEFETVRLLQQVNLGPATARNTGARAANGEILAFTDADCAPQPDWIRELVAALEDGAVASGGTYACANPGNRLARVIQAEIAQRHARFGTTVDFLGSYNVAYRAPAFSAVGGFDERYRYASAEDNDLSYRLQDAGGRLVFNPRAVVAHYHPECLRAYLRTQARHGTWRIQLYRDHPARAVGDQYAKWPDLIAPPLGLALLLFLPIAGLLAVGGFPGAVLLAYGVLVPLYIGLHLPIVMRLSSALSLLDALYFLILVCLRDIARGIGMLGGLRPRPIRHRGLE